ncbi:MAG: S46 family peptidase [Planctomycetes bacterium]|nr:S46 family peptidase [Planctomycetota bacterium]
MNKPAFVTAFVLLTLTPLAPADEGMWLLNQPPTATLKSRYGFEPSAAWLEHMQKSAVRIGASGSFVSPNGLILTNHHVGSDQLQKLSTPQRDLIKDGFYASTPADELKCPDLEIQVLWSIQDVTEQVLASTAGKTGEAAVAARRACMSDIEGRSKKDTGLDSEVVTLYHGARYHLYRYKRYDDLRLVFAPEMQTAFFGGDNDNFEYPRFCLDVCMFRAYENGKPLRVEHYLKWSKGAADGDLAIVFGHPGSTNRLYSMAHLEFWRDVEMPFSLNRLWRREVQLQTFMARNDENYRIGVEDFFGVQNGRKARTGTLAGLLDPKLMKSKADDEAALRKFVDADPKRKAEWGGAWDRLATAEAGWRTHFLSNELLNGRGLSGGSELFGLARSFVRLADELEKPNGERLREYRETELDSLRLSLISDAPIHDALEIDRLAGGLSLAAENLGGGDPLVTRILAGQSPHERAVGLVQGCTLKDASLRRQLFDGGSAAIRAHHDPMIDFFRAIDADARALRKRHEDEVESVERDCYAQIAAARFARDGESVYPDATGTLRMAFGPIRGYSEDGKAVPAFTTFAGLYQRNQERHGAPPFQLLPRWEAARSKLHLDTPYNFVCTADIIGGNSGSPIVNKAGELIGLIFDGNIQSLSAGIAYSDEQSRAVAVDSRAIIEALRVVYGASALADELEGKQDAK